MADEPPFRFTFMLDGLGDPSVARELTRAVHQELDHVARSDPAGLWLEVQSRKPIDEQVSDQVAALARRFALEPRDRVGSTFVPSLSAEHLRQRLAYEWTSRWATGLVFLLPALALHYLTPMLAQGGRLIPGMIEAALVIWSLIAACWPIAWQGSLALRERRITPDLFNLAGLTLTLFAGLVQVILARENVLHITAYFILAATTQRMIISRRAGRLDGNAHLMPPSRWILLVVLLGGLILAPFDLEGGAAVLLAMPAMISLLSINRLVHPFGAMIPALLMCGLLALAPTVLPDHLLAGRIESAFAFNILLTLVYGSALGAPGRAAADESLSSS